MMNKVLISPSISIVIDPGCRDWLTLEMEANDGATIGIFLKGLGETYPELGRMLFDADSGGISDGIDLVLNGNLLKNPDVTGIKLADGDTVTILPAYFGG